MSYKLACPVASQEDSGISKKCRLNSKLLYICGKVWSMDDKFGFLEKYNLWGGNTPQLGFIRKEYTEKIVSYTGNRLIKVLVGQRRTGKSYILRQLATQLVASGVDKKRRSFT